MSKTFLWWGTCSAHIAKRAFAGRGRLKSPPDAYALVMQKSGEKWGDVQQTTSRVDELLRQPTGVDYPWLSRRHIVPKFSRDDLLLSWIRSNSDAPGLNFFASLLASYLIRFLLDFSSDSSHFCNSIQLLLPILDLAVKFSSGCYGNSVVARYKVSTSTIDR